MTRLKDKIIVVTGGKGLLGTSFFQRITEEKGTAIIADTVSSDDVLNGEVICDITNLKSIEKAVNQIISAYGRIDGWINNAYPRTKDWGKSSFSTESMDSFSTNVEWHLMGYVKCCQIVLNQMKRQGHGALVNLASIYGIVGPDFSIYEGTSIGNPAAYSVIKGGIINFTRYLAALYGPFNIRVNCVSPGGIFDNQQSVFVENYERKVPLRRMGNPSDIAPSVCFLLSDDAAYITGHNLVVDGGWTAI